MNANSSDLVDFEVRRRSVGNKRFGDVLLFLIVQVGWTKAHMLVGFSDTFCDRGKERVDKCCDLVLKSFLSLKILFFVVTGFV